jgi:hypothetical protein
MDTKANRPSDQGSPIATSESDSTEPIRLKILDLSAPTTCLPPLPPPIKKKRARKVRVCEPRREFGLIHYLSKDATESLDKLRNDLEESIERTIRIEQAFVKELTKHSRYSNRVKIIIQAVGEIPFHSELQRKILSKGITSILESQKRLLAEQAELKRQRQQEECTACYFAQ